MYKPNNLYDGGSGLIELVNYYKPARSIIRQVNFPIEINATSYHGSSLRVHQSIMLKKYVVDKEEKNREFKINTES